VDAGAVIDYAALSPADLADVHRLAADQHTLGDVLDWCRARDLLARWPEVTTQDEYTHDVVVPYREPLYLAYDAT
jgi:hypothetical protein